MGKNYEKGLYSPELMEEIRSRFKYMVRIISLLTSLLPEPFD